MNKKVILIIISLLILNTQLISLETEARVKWGWPSHHYIVTQAIEELPDDWQEVYGSLISLVKAGSILPDTWGDWNNHLYYPSNPSLYSGPQAIETWYNYFVTNLSQGNYYDGILAGSVMSHYLADLNIPVHTGPNWEGHSAYETDVNNHIEDFTIGSITLDTNISSIQEYAIDAAENANLYYDLIHEAYPDDTVNGAVISNATVKSITEQQLTRAIACISSLWIQGINNALAPSILEATDHKALIDIGHSNDYASTSDLENLVAFLENIGFAVIKDNDGIDNSDLIDVDFLVITAIAENYTVTELDAITNWVQNNDQSSIFISGRGDFTSEIEHAGINDILYSIGAHIRMNDDNVYTTNNDPHAYLDHEWYVYSDIIEGPIGEDLPGVTLPFHSFSPNSLYFTEQSIATVNVLVNGSIYNYQTNENEPGIETVWDITDDNIGGNVIPLVASETLNDDNDRLIVFGDTSFSDFSFGPSGHHDNEKIIQYYLDWVLFGNANIEDFLPTVEIDDSVTEFQAGELTINFRYSTNVATIKLYINEVLEDTFTLPENSYIKDFDTGSYNITVLVISNEGTINSDSLQITVEEISSTNPDSTTQTSSEETELTSTTEPLLETTPLKLNIFLISLAFTILLLGKRKK